MRPPDEIDDLPPPRPRSKKPSGGIMSLGGHLEELRRRIIFALLGVLPIFLGALAIARPLLEFLMAPVQAALRAEGARPLLISTGVLETFDTWLKVAVMVTIIVGSPWLLYQAWLFVAPGLYRHEKRFVHFLLPLSTLLIAAGVAFLYLAVLPVMLHFFIHFGSTLGKPTIATAEPPAGLVLPIAPVLDADPPAPTAGQMWVNKKLQELRVCVEPAPATGGEPKVLGMPLTSGAGVEPSFRVSEYVNLLTTLAIAFAAAFQTPVVVLLLGWAGIVTPKTLANYRRHAAMIVGIIAALLTPADVFSMLLMGIPMYLLYELGGILLRLFPAKRVASREDDRSPEDGPPIHEHQHADR